MGCNSSKNKSAISISNEQQSTQINDHDVGKCPRSAVYKHQSLKQTFEPPYNPSTNNTKNKPITDQLAQSHNDEFESKEEVNRSHNLTLSRDSIASRSLQPMTTKQIHNPTTNIQSIKGVGIVFDSALTKRHAYVCDNSLQKCPYLNRLKTIMKQYTDKNTTHIQAINMSMILDDFLHLLKNHDTDKECEFILNAFGLCDIKHCKIFCRNYRLRNKNELCLNNINKQLARNKIFDKIHCYYCHCFDIGNRLSIKDKLQIKNVTEFKHDGNHCCLINGEIIALNQLLLNKRKIFQDFQLTQFVSRIKLKNDQLDESNMDALKTDDQNQYNFGLKIKYKEDSSTPMSAQLHAIPKRSSFKDEMINNDICSLTMNQFQCENEKAQIHFNTEYRKQYYSDVKLDYLLAMMIYCNYTCLQYEFSKTYRNHFGAMHNNFYHLGKYLKILVNKFGTEIQNSPVKKFYHGIGQQLFFPAYISNIYMYGPLSTTSSLPVATNFTNLNNGMVVEFMGWKQSQCKYFSTSWVSDFNESEYFFIQNQHSLEIKNIILCELGCEFRQILHALKIIDSFTVEGKNIDCVENRIKQLIHKIICHQLSSKLNECKTFDSLHAYGKKLIMTYFENKNRVCIGDSMKNIHSFLLDFFINSHENEIKVKQIQNMFPNVAEIFVFNIDICKATMNSVLTDLSAMNDNAKIRQIMIHTNANEYSKNILSQYSDAFNKIKFILSVKLDSMVQVIIEKVKSE